MWCSGFAPPGQARRRPRSRRARTTPSRAGGRAYPARLARTRDWPDREKARRPALHRAGHSRRRHGHRSLYRVRGRKLRRARIADHHCARGVHCRNDIWAVRRTDLGAALPGRHHVLVPRGLGRGRIYRTADLTATIAALIGTEGLDLDEALAFRFMGTGEREAASFESSGAAPKLVIEFDTGPPETPAAVPRSCRPGRWFSAVHRRAGERPRARCGNLPVRQRNGRCLLGPLGRSSIT